MLQLAEAYCVAEFRPVAGRVKNASAALPTNNSATLAVHIRLKEVSGSCRFVGDTNYNKEKVNSFTHTNLWQ